MQGEHRVEKAPSPLAERPRLSPWARGLIELVRSTVIGGLLFLLPLALIIYLVVQVVQAASHHALKPVSSTLQISEGLAAGIIVLALLGVCFCAGMFARTRAARRVMDSIENSTLHKLPQYQQLKKTLKGLEGGEKQHERPAMVLGSEGWELGFVVEEMEAGFVAVYLPNVPTVTTGRLVYVQRDQLRLVDLTISQALEILWGGGIGSNRFIRGATLEPLRQQVPPHKAE